MNVWCCKIDTKFDEVLSVYYAKCTHYHLLTEYIHIQCHWL